jgi:hypothetical protein
LPQDYCSKWDEQEYLSILTLGTKYSKEVGGGGGGEHILIIFSNKKKKIMKKPVSSSVSTVIAVWALRVRQDAAGSNILFNYVMDSISGGYNIDVRSLC